MKTNLNTVLSLVRNSSILAAISLLVLPMSLSAQTKGSSQLIPSRTSTAAVASKSGTMDCAQCKDTLKTTSATAKGGRIEKLTLQVHMCPACETRNTTSKQGKLAQNQVSHTCKMQKTSSGSCCESANQAKAQ